MLNQFKTLLIMSVIVMIGPTLSCAFGANCWQPSISFFYDETIEDFAVGFGLQNEKMEFEISGTIDFNDPASGISYTQYNIGLISGLRHHLAKDVTGSFGFLGNIGFYDSFYNAGQNGKDNDPLTIGPYLGLGYQPTDHISIFVRIMPVSYERTSSNQIGIEVFQEGLMGMKYLF